MLLALGLGFASGCSGGDGTTAPIVPPIVGAASVVVLSASVRGADIGVDEVTIRLRNDGGPGVFIVQFWALRSSPSGQHRLLGETQGVEVLQGYDETVAYRVPVPNTLATSWIIARTRPLNSAVFVQSACFRIGGGTCPPP